MNETKTFIKTPNGLVGIGLRELTNEENANLCQNETRSNLTQPPILKSNGLIFKNNISILVFTSGCYYLNKTTGQWLSDGVEVQIDTNTTHTHCISSHLTEFAGGFVVVPNQINFDYVWANADFLRNPTIYAIVIAITCLYLILLVWSYWMDLVDLKKTQIYVLKDNCMSDSYFYEVVLFTGNRKNAGTESRVKINFNFFK